MNAAYPLFPLAIPVVLLYALSFAFSRIGLVSKQNHRKFWNVLLLLTFLASALLGLFMVVKINYKLQFPFYEKLVAYHVEFGIGMALIGFFHLWWNFGYYLKIFGRGSRTEKQLKEMENDGKTMASNGLPSPSFFKIAAFLLGSTTIIAQVILMREFLTVFSGNELVIGLVLANWMILTGLGAWLGKLPVRIKKPFNFLSGGMLLLSVLPFITAFLINFLKNRIFPVGALINLFQICWSSLVLLVPFCLLSGFLFTFISTAFSESKNRNETGSVYGFESLGSVVGGLLSGLLFIFVFSSVESLLVLAIVNGLILFLSGQKYTSYKRTWLPLAVVFPALIALFFQPEKLIRSFVYPNQEIVVSKDSPYGNMVITRREKMWSVYLNNNLLFDSENFMLNEEAVHFAMLQHPRPASVLLVSGGIAGQLGELRKYKPASIDYIEDNRWLLALMKDTLARISGEAVRTEATDPLRFIRKTSRIYDVAILNLPGPSSMQANRFYTVEFFEALKKKMSSGGIVSFSVSMPVNYQNQEAVDLNSTLLASLKTAFRNVIILPGEKLYFLASDAPLTYHIAQAVWQKGIENRYVNPDYFNDELLQQRGEVILAALNPSVAFNQNLNPVSYWQQISFWLSQFSGKYRILTALAGFLALFVFVRGNRHSQTIFITGFSASALEILLLFGLQVFFGNIYLLTSFVFAGFMAGLAAGSFRGKNISGKHTIAMIQMLFGLLALLVGLSLFTKGMTSLPAALVYGVFMIAVTVTGGLTGFQFAQISRESPGSYSEISGKTYSYDLAGSALGALAVSIYLVPRFGIGHTIWVIAGINLVFAGWLFLKTRAKI